MRKFYILTFILFICLASLRSQTFEGYIFTLKENAALQEVESYFAERNIPAQFTLIATSIQAYTFAPNILNIREAQKPSIEQHLDQCPAIREWQRNYRLQPRDVIPNDPEYNNQWYLDKIKMAQGWDISTGQLGSQQPIAPVVGIIEAGITVNQVEFADIFYRNPDEIANNGIDDDGNGYIDDISGWNFNSNSPDHNIDDTYHGDAVTGVIAAKSNNGRSIAGINWHPQIMIISLEDRATNALTIQAYEYFYQERKKFNDTQGQEGSFIAITNSSFGEDGLFASDVPIFCAMYAKMGSVGILSVGATTNSESNVDNFGDIPSDCPADELIIVTSIDQTNDIRGGFGKKNVDIAAPGTDIPTINEGDEILLDAGTSFATPQVVGVLSLAYSLPLDSLYQGIMKNPVITSAVLKNCLLSNVQSTPELELRSVSGGILDAAACLTCVKEHFTTEQNNQTTFKISKVQPNVTIDHIEVTVDNAIINERIRYGIYDYIGKCLFTDYVEINQATGRYHIDVNFLPAGGYVLRFDQNNAQSSWKFIKM